jgi:ABC transporter substrate binding protein
MGKSERLAELAADLVREKVDLIVTEGTPSTLAAMHATTMIPIVFGSMQDPIEKGVVASRFSCALYRQDGLCSRGARSFQSNPLIRSTISRLGGAPTRAPGRL